MEGYAIYSQLWDDSICDNVSQELPLDREDENYPPIFTIGNWTVIVKEFVVGITI